MNSATLPPLVYSNPYAFLFWSIFAWAYWPEFLLIIRPPHHAKKIETKSLPVLTGGLALAFAFAFSVSWTAAWRWSADAARFTFFGGLILLVLGSLLRRHCWRMLGNFFTAHVAVRSDQAVITTGAYAWVRHPSYSGALLMNIGIGMALGSWASVALLLIASVALYSYRIAIEEKVLLATLGEPYRDFMASRKRLVPFVY